MNAQQTNGPLVRGALAKKIAEVQKGVEKVPKRGHASVSMRGGGSYSYDYIQESDLMDAIRPVLAEKGVGVFYSDKIVDWRIDDGGTMTAIIEVELVLVDGDSGDEQTMRAQGIGTDKGDKAANKAKTSAMRYLLWKWFLVPSDQDPEQENVEREPRGSSRPAVVAAPEEKVQEFLDEVEQAGFDRTAAEAPLRDEEGKVATLALERAKAAFERARASAPVAS